TRFSDWTMFRSGGTPAFLAVVSVEYADGWSESYLLPLALVSGAEAERAVKHAPARTLARITGARKGAIIDGLDDDAVCDRLLAMVVSQQELATTRGTVRGVHVGQTPELPAERTWTRGSGDQSNSVAFVNDRHMVKLFRRIEPGIN